MKYYQVVVPVPGTRFWLSCIQYHRVPILQYIQYSRDHRPSCLLVCIGHRYRYANTRILMPSQSLLDPNYQVPVHSHRRVFCDFSSLLSPSLLPQNSEKLLTIRPLHLSTYIDIIAIVRTEGLWTHLPVLSTLIQ